MSVPQPAHALIGHSGFVGSTLKKQHRFTHFYRSANRHDLVDSRFELAICCAAPAQKWLANQDPETDWASIDQLCQVLAKTQADQFVLISTVDVFGMPCKVDEQSPIDLDGLHPYGLHRRKLEMFVADHFRSHLIIRLPGLVGPGLRKNVIYDLHHGNDLHKVDHRGIFQFYPMVNLWKDIQIAVSSRISLLHLTATPCSVAEISWGGFGRVFENRLVGDPARYDFRTLYSSCFGGQGFYQYSKRESMLAIRAYAQSEPHS